MTLDNFFADRETDASAGEFFALVKALEHAENSFEVLRIDAEAIVFDGEHPFRPAIFCGGDVYPGDSAVLIFDGVADEILKFREQVGDFGTLLYAGKDWRDPALGKRSMTLLAEKVLPKVNTAIKAK